MRILRNQVSCEPKQCMQCTTLLLNLLYKPSQLDHLVGRGATKTFHAGFTMGNMATKTTNTNRLPLHSYGRHFGNGHILEVLHLWFCHTQDRRRCS